MGPEKGKCCTVRDRDEQWQANTFNFSAQSSPQPRPGSLEKASRSQAEQAPELAESGPRAPIDDWLEAWMELQRDPEESAWASSVDVLATPDAQQQHQEATERERASSFCTAEDSLSRQLTPAATTSSALSALEKSEEQGPPQDAGADEAATRKLHETIASLQQALEKERRTVRHLVAKFEAMQVVAPLEPLKGPRSQKNTKRTACASGEALEICSSEQLVQGGQERHPAVDALTQTDLAVEDVSCAEQCLPEAEEQELETETESLLAPLRLVEVEAVASAPRVCSSGAAVVATAGADAVESSSQEDAHPLTDARSSDIAPIQDAGAQQVQAELEAELTREVMAKVTEASPLPEADQPSNSVAADADTSDEKPLEPLTAAAVPAREETLATSAVNPNTAGHPLQQIREAIAEDAEESDGSFEFEELAMEEEFFVFSATQVKPEAAQQEDLAGDIWPLPSAVAPNKKECVSDMNSTLQDQHTRSSFTPEVERVVDVDSPGIRDRSKSCPIQKLPTGNSEADQAESRLETTIVARVKKVRSAPMTGTEEVSSSSATGWFTNLLQRFSCGCSSSEVQDKLPRFRFSGTDCSQEPMQKEELVKSTEDPVAAEAKQPHTIEKAFKYSPGEEGLRPSPGPSPRVKMTKGDIDENSLVAGVRLDFMSKDCHRVGYSENTEVEASQGALGPSRQWDWLKCDSQCTRQHSFRQKRRWCHSQSFLLCREGDFGKHEDAASTFDLFEAASASKCIEELNNGHQQCEAGICIVHSGSEQAYFVVYERRCEVHALRSFPGAAKKGSSPMSCIESI